MKKDLTLIMVVLGLVMSATAAFVVGCYPRPTDPVPSCAEAPWQDWCAPPGCAERPNQPGCPMWLKARDGGVDGSRG